MKKIILAALAAIMMSLPACAQSYTTSKYYNPKTGKIEYKGSNGFSLADNDHYIGVRLGPAFTHVGTKAEELKGGGSRVGLDATVVYGMQLTDQAPLYFETGLSYIEKGGKSKNAQNEKINYNLNYLQIPFVIKYIYELEEPIAIHPFFGGYMGLGVGGKTKNLVEHTTYSSFSGDKDKFRRFDIGLNIGCGASYDLVYAELAYQIGLANINHNLFDEAHNHAFVLTFGVNF